MEFLDEFESKPRFLLQSKNLPQPDRDDHLNPSSFSSFLTSLHKPTLLISLSISLAIFILLFLYFNFEPYQSILLWLALSLLIGPFAPPSLTAGDISVGVGPPLKEIPEISTETTEKLSRKSIRSLKKASDGNLQKYTAIDDGPVVDFAEKNQSDKSIRVSNDKKFEEEEEGKSEWSEIDEDLLRKLMTKHPVGMPGRWDAIAEGFKGKHKVETIITRAKEMGSRKGSDRDSYEKFLKARKPVDKRAVLDEGEGEMNGEIGILDQSESEWSAAEDLALLNALKAFPKEVAMRWEKIEASVPGKTKTACVKRVADLKKGFRNSKGSSGSQAS
ncbi:Dnaj homolog subfamily c member 2 [Phtheirospermum japonicum]|uniref:Dnaj homolog subfamily c member 2 n=1 Tax=Phtheirospermum japonicum TaxID=374723 RepID=A0A830CDM4_9LAMI|nr:Dnaj homolog subfamily c member 2 [Phtheirospermum japonicum]